MFQVRLLRRRLNERFLKVWSGFFVLLYPSDVTLFDYCPITVCPWLFLLGFAMFDNVPISPYILDVETVSLPSLVAFLELVVMLLIFKTWHDPLNWHHGIVVFVNLFPLENASNPLLLIDGRKQAVIYIFFNLNWHYRRLSGIASIWFLDFHAGIFRTHIRLASISVFIASRSAC